jgi:DNA-binding MarR family transcriptional regulator
VDGCAVLIFFKEEPHMNRLNKFKLCGALNATIAGKLIYLVLDDLADENGEIIVPQRRISNTLQLSRKTVSRNLRRLRDRGYISIMAQYHDDGGRAANKYVVK